MNASIRAIIDHMFKDTVDTAETRALHEELLNNCLEHYDDLISRGMSDTEAIDAVVDSLKGMKEVIDEYPKKPGHSEEDKPEPEKQQEVPVINAEKPAGNAPEQERPTEYVFSAGSVQSLRTDLKNCDLQIKPSQDGQIHVRCEDMDQLACSLDGSVLNVRIVDNTKKAIEDAGKEINNTEFTLKGLLNFIGKAINGAASSITVSWNVYIELPAVSIREMDLNAKSGDIEMKAVLPERLVIHTMSGDVDVEAKSDRYAEKVSVSAMSGEIDFSGNAKTITLSSMSGDVTARGNYGDAEMKSTSGDAKLKGTADIIRLNSVSGDVNAELHSTSVSRIEARTTSGDTEIELAPGTDSVHASVSTVTGSASCRIPDAGTGAKLIITASSVSGDVTIR